MLCGLPMRKLGAVVGSPLPAPCTPPQGLALAAGPAAQGGGCRGDDASSPRLCSPRGLEVAFFGREASRRAHVGCSDETGGGRRRRCDCGACAKELAWPPPPSCLAWGLPRPPHSTSPPGQRELLDNNTFLMRLEQPAKIPGLSWSCVSANSRHPDERAGREVRVISANANTCREPCLLQAPRRMWAGWCRVCLPLTHPELCASSCHHPEPRTAPPPRVSKLLCSCPKQQEESRSPLPPLLIQPAPSHVTGQDEDPVEWSYGVVPSPPQHHVG